MSLTERERLIEIEGIQANVKFHRKNIEIEPFEKGEINFFDGMPMAYKKLYNDVLSQISKEKPTLLHASVAAMIVWKVRMGVTYDQETERVIQSVIENDFDPKSIKVIREEKPVKKIVKKQVESDSSFSETSSDETTVEKVVKKEEESENMTSESESESTSESESESTSESESESISESESTSESESESTSESDSEGFTDSDEDSD
jgi:hypothetical protein